MAETKPLVEGRAPVAHETSSNGEPMIELLIAELSSLRKSMLELASRMSGELRAVHPPQVRSAENLLHYVALRRHDIRELQEALESLGLSSLGRSESHVRHNVDCVLELLHRLGGRECPDLEKGKPLPATEGRRLLREHAEALLGPKPAGRSVRIMVTMPETAAKDAGLVRDLVASGMDSCRINCAHDDRQVWERIVANVRAAEKALSRPCRILMDVGGPKSRVGPIAPGPQVLSWHPRRDDLGAVEKPARIWLAPADRPGPAPAGADVVLPVPGELLCALREGDRIDLRDARGKKRPLDIREVSATGGLRGAWATSEQTAYVEPGTTLRIVRDGKKTGSKCVLGALPSVERVLLLKPGERLVLTAAPIPGEPAPRDASGRATGPSRVSLTLPEVFPAVRPGHSVWFDDGKIGSVVESATAEELVLRITVCPQKGTKLRADRGVNFPDTDLPIEALSAKDKEDLETIVEHADMVGLSFVREAKDVHALRAELSRLGRPDLPIVLKIETRRAFEELPSLLLAAMRGSASGVMIARGDLAVECGWERLAEVQEEILWMCEAAHMPVIWATQVLETLTKKGKPSRSEITDAAMAERAECVMLNKGPHIVHAVRVLEDILRRMETHQSKKRAMLRALSLANGFGNDCGEGAPSKGMA